MRTLNRISGLLFIAVLAVLPLKAHAAPQILGLLASVEPTKLTCSGETCSAEFSSFCLQQHRKTPDQGTAYRPSKLTHMTVSVKGPDGEVRRQSVARHVTVRSLRGYTSVAISLPRSFVRALGDGPAGLSIGETAALIPEQAGLSTHPLSRHEIDLYTGPLRRAATGTTGREPSNLQAARLLSRMVNDLPADRDLSQAAREDYWSKTVGKRSWQVTDQAYKRAVKAFRTCKGDYNRYGINGMRGCLGHEHDGAMIDITRKVWADQKGGS